MKLTLLAEDATRFATGLIGLPIFSVEKSGDKGEAKDATDEDYGAAIAADELAASFDRALDGLVKRVVSDEKWKPKKGATLLLHTHGRLPAQRILLVGMGARKDAQPTDARGLGARVVKAAAAAHQNAAAVALPALSSGVAVAQLAAEGAQLGGYRFDKYLTGERKKFDPVAELSLLVPTGEAARLDTLRAGVARGEKVAAAVAQARDLINEPAADMTPIKMAEVAEKLAAARGLAIKVLGPKECKALGMGMFLGVAQGSDEEPRFIHLTYKPSGKPTKKVVLVGKGVTFDSGGLSLKPSAGMEDMKIDMSGAAAVIAAIGLIAELGSPHEVHAVAACTENMPSGKSYKLGDVLRSMNGKTVEINNTDAEGRLTLGDAITYALTEVKPDEIFDFATLTGACMVALGPHIAGVMSNDDALAERWLAAAKAAGEEMWRLPLPERLREMLKSEIADMRNTGAREGGALTAGLFLKEFVGETPWVHVDLAGPASADKEAGHVAKGGTGFAVATMAQYLASLAPDDKSH